MRQQQALLIWPPAGSLSGPPLGLAAVAGHLRAHRPEVQVDIADLNVVAAHAILQEASSSADLQRIVRSRWTQADIIQDALSRWAFGGDAPAGIGALPDWECHFVALVFGECLDGFVSSIERSPDLIGISVCDNGLIAAIGLTRKFRARFPNARIVWGGVSITEEQGPALLCAVPELDAVVIGAGEEAILALVDALPGLSDASGVGVLTRDAPRVTQRHHDDYLPTEPAFGLFNLRLYRALELPMSIGKGCAWGKCAFCDENYAVAGYRSIEPERSAAWALEWQQRYRPVSFDLVDSAANSNLHSLRRFVDVLLRGGGLREWRCMMRTAGLRKEDLQLARQSGLRTVYFGLEAFDDSVLQQMQKGTTVAQHLRAISLALELGLNVEGDLILYFPTDTPEAVRRAISIVGQYDHLFARVGISFSRFVPAVGSQASEQSWKYGIKVLAHSLRLARHLPASIASALIPWDPVWDFNLEDRPRSIELTKAYLELQSSLAQLRATAPQRVWYKLDRLVVLETYRKETSVLDRIFLEGGQRDIWNAIVEPRSVGELARTTGFTEETVTNFLSRLAAKGFAFGWRDNWARVTPEHNSSHAVGIAVRNCTSQSLIPGQT